MNRQEGGSFGARPKSGSARWAASKRSVLYSKEIDPGLESSMFNVRSNSDTRLSIQPEPELTVNPGSRTSAAGAFTAALLPVGTYELSARLMGFATLRIPAITVTVGQTRFVQVLMKLSAVETTIEVEDKPSVAKLLQFETSTLIDNSQAPRFHSMAAGSWISPSW